MERIREEVSISCNCADKAKIINRFSIDSLKKLFKIELFEVSKWLAKTSTRLYHSKKSHVLSVFTTCDMLLTGPSAAIIIELSPLVQARDPTNCRAVSSFDISFILKNIKNSRGGGIRVDVITNRYFNNSLKEGTQGARGNEETTFGDISDHDEIPSNFQKDFIGNSFNKDTLYQYLAESSMIFILLLLKYL